MGCVTERKAQGGRRGTVSFYILVRFALIEGR